MIAAATSSPTLSTAERSSAGEVFTFTTHGLSAAELDIPSTNAKNYERHRAEFLVKVNL